MQAAELNMDVGESAANADVRCLCVS